MSTIKYIPASALANRSTFAAFLRDGTVAPTVTEEITRERWVWFGEDNLAPERWRELADNCVPLGRCVDMAALFLAGRGVRFVDEEGEEIQQAQDRFQEWMMDTTEEEFLHRTALDVALLNGFAWDVTPLIGGRAVGRLNHRDAMRLRVGKPNNEGEIDSYWYSQDWMLYRRRQRYKPYPLKPFEYGGRMGETATLYAKTYKQGRDFYSEPWWISATNDAEVWAKVPVFNRTQLDTGFSPVVHLHLETERDEADISKMYDDIVDSYTGASGQGVFLTFGRSGENVQLTPLQRGDHAGELDAMRTNAEKVVVRSYGIPGILYGVDDVNTGLDGAGSALEAALEQFQRTWVVPRQKLITKHLSKLMALDGIQVWDCVIEPIEVVDAKTEFDETYRMTVTVNEHREMYMDLPPIEGGEKLIKSGNTSAQMPDQNTEDDGADLD